MKTCSRCRVEKPLAAFWRNPKSPDGRLSRCAKCDYARFVKYKKQHPAAIAASKAAWQKKNPDKVAEANRRARLSVARKIWKQENREKLNAQSRALRISNPVARAASASRLAGWQKKNSHRCAAHTRARDAAKLRAVPAWADHSAIAGIYAEAVRLRRETGERYEVDHAVPLQGKTVSGLHWEGNLQILLKAENISKHNRRWPDMPT